MAFVAQVGQLVESTIDRLKSASGPFEAWTPVQTLDHLVQVHRGVVLGLRSQQPMPKRGSLFGFRRQVVKFILTNAIPVPAKGAYPTCSPDADFEEMASELRKLQGKLEKRVADGIDPNAVVMMHPVAGPLNLEETLEIVHAHLMYHYKRAGK